MADFLEGLAARIKHNDTARQNHERMYLPPSEVPKANEGAPLRTNSMFKHVQVIYMKRICFDLLVKPCTNLQREPSCVKNAQAKQLQQHGTRRLVVCLNPAIKAYATVAPATPKECT